MATLLVDHDTATVTIELTTFEKVEGLLADLTFPISAITGARVIEEAISEVRGFRVGTHLPGVEKVGTWFTSEGGTYAVCHHNGPGVVIDPAEGGAGHIREVVLTMDDPSETLVALRG